MTITLNAAAAAMLAASAAIAAPGAPETVLYQAPAAWVSEPPTAAEPTGAAETPVRVRYLDNQLRITGDGGEENYTAYRLKILKPEGLAIGNISATWQPEAGSLTIHRLQRIRDGVVTDVLATTKFAVLQRETQLDQSMLTGQRTATLQVPGLAVGDELVFAATVRRREPVFDGHVAGLMQLPVLGAPGAFRARLLWPKDRTLALQSTKDLTLPVPTLSGTEKRLELLMVDPAGATPTEGAPPRYNVRRLIEYSDFGAWTAVSRQMGALFDSAAALDANSPLRAEIAAIAARSSDPAERARAALQLVEDRIRYVYVGLDGANYRPARADDTWQRRFGDCKAKTVLLVALLRGLGIDARSALVNSSGGDGIDERLPDPRVFDHVVTRAVVLGKVQWLDATRQGDRFFDQIPLPFRWALPLDPAGRALERIAPRDDGYPVIIGLAEIDARAGTDKDAHVVLRNVLRGDEAFGIRSQLAALSREDADRALKSYWRQQANWITPDSVAWHYDELQRAIMLEVRGDGNPGWKEENGGQTMTIVGAGLYPPDTLRRPREQDQTAPWSVPFPRFKCWATTIYLPKPRAEHHWSLYAEPMNRKLGGFTYWRQATLSGEMLRTVQSTRTYEDEVSPEEAAIVNRAIPGFNNNMSSISEVAGSAPTRGAVRLPFGDDVDWIKAPAPCLAEP